MRFSFLRTLVESRKLVIINIKDKELSLANCKTPSPVKQIPDNETKTCWKLVTPYCYYINFRSKLNMSKIVTSIVTCVSHRGQSHTCRITASVPCARPNHCRTLTVALMERYVYIYAQKLSFSPSLTAYFQISASAVLVIVQFHTHTHTKCFPLRQEDKLYADYLY